MVTQNWMMKAQLPQLEYKLYLQLQWQVLKQWASTARFGVWLARDADMPWAVFKVEVGENNKGADQPAHPRSLISIIVIRFLEIIIRAKFQFSS